MPYDGLSGPQTLTENGETGKISKPETRFENASAAQDFVRRLIQNDEKRSKKRGLVAGLVDGNAPYRHGKLREANRAEAANVNFGTARSYMENAAGAFYDLSSQAPGFVEVETEYGNDEQRIEYSRIMSKEADEIFRADDDFDQDMQLSQNEMVLYGTGPFYFENEFQVFPVAIESGCLLVPDRTRSKLSRWEASALIWDYYPPELYEFIREAEAAKSVGWDVEFTRHVISKAVDIRQNETNTNHNWEWYQNLLKSNACDYYDGTLVIKLAHLFWRDFPTTDDVKGRVTHAIVERDSLTRQGIKYLFFKKDRYANFDEAINPMYFDRGRGGYHHNITGLGVKQYGPMELENRGLCKMWDDVFAPRILFKPTTTEATQKLQLARFGSYGVLPAGTDYIQNPVQGYIQDGLAMFNANNSLMRSNLSAYRKGPTMDKPGNPVTKFEKQVEVSEEGALSNTTYNRYYRQLDGLYFQIVRRLCNLNSTDERAKRFQKNCLKQGVPKECFGRLASVKAVRVIGQGSPLLRRNSLMELGNIVGGFPEEGQMNWRNDLIAATCGQTAVDRYNPRGEKSLLISEQKERAQNQIVGMRSGVPPVPSDSQNPMIFASMFLQAGVSALQSLKQGANPQQVLSFLSLAGPSIAFHVQRLEKDPIKKPVAEEIMNQWKRLAQATDKLKKMVQQRAEQMKNQRQKTQAAMSDSQIKAAKARADIAIKNAKARNDIMLKRAHSRLELAGGVQRMQLADAETAASINRSGSDSFEE